MTQHRSSIRLIVLTLFAVLALTACSSNRPETPVTTSLPTTTSGAPIESSAISSEISVNSPVALAYHPDSGDLLMASNMGLLRWSAGGSWLEIKTPDAADLSSVIVNLEQPALIYASGSGLGVIRSNDRGATWQAVNIGLPGLDVTALASHSFRGETLYAWVRGDGIYSTEDGGANWKRVPDQGPPDADVRGLIHSTLPGSMKTGWLYASTPSGAYLSMDCF